MAGAPVRPLAVVPPPDDLTPLINRQIQTQTVIIDIWVDETGNSRFIFLQHEPSGRIVEYFATLNSSREVRDAGPDVTTSLQRRPAVIAPAPSLRNPLLPLRSRSPRAPGPY